MFVCFLFMPLLFPSFFEFAFTCLLSLQSGPGLGGPVDCSPPGSSVYGILQARILECVAMPSSRGSYRSRDQTHVSYVFCIGNKRFLFIYFILFNLFIYLFFYHGCHLWNPLSQLESEIEGQSVMPNSSPWDSPGQNTGVGNISLHQGIFQTQGSNPGLLHCRWILYQLSHRSSPLTLYYSDSNCNSLILPSLISLWAIPLTHIDLFLISRS